MARRPCDVFPRGQLQVAVHKGDMSPGLTESSFLLTYIEKPIIINSFQKAEGLESEG
jgi:hypothetical protein